MIKLQYLNITNLEQNIDIFEKMAKKGYLIDKVIGGGLFIYKKIKPMDLDFQITVIEMETFFEKKEDKDFYELDQISDDIGWNLACRTNHFHIYYKEASNNIINLNTDDEELFYSLERIGKKQVKQSVMLLIWLSIITAINYKIIFSDKVYFYKSYLQQIVGVILPIALIFVIKEIYYLNKFLNINKRNIEENKDITFLKRNMFINNSFVCLSIILFAIIILAGLYLAIFKSNKLIIYAFIPLLLGIIIGHIFRFKIKGKSYTKGKKMIIFITMIVGVSIIYPVRLIILGDNLFREKHDIDRNKYKVLLNNDFTNNDQSNEGIIINNLSFLLKDSYEYLSRGRSVNSYFRIVTEYNEAFSEKIAIKLQKAYIDDKIKEINKSIDRDIDNMKENEYYNNNYAHVNLGISKEEFNLFLDKGFSENSINELKELVVENKIKDVNYLWKLDSAYMLDNDNKEILIRDKKKVILLKGVDFSSEKNINIVKDKLNLN